MVFFDFRNGGKETMAMKSGYFCRTKLGLSHDVPSLI